MKSYFKRWSHLMMNLTYCKILQAKMMKLITVTTLIICQIQINSVQKPLMLQILSSSTPLNISKLSFYAIPELPKLISIFSIQERVFICSWNFVQINIGRKWNCIASKCRWQMLKYFSFFRIHFTLHYIFPTSEP